MADDGALLGRLKRRFRRWALRGRRAEAAPIHLDRRRVYVLPTGAGIAYALALPVLLLAAINYNLSLGHALVFLLAGLGLAALLETFRSLAGLSLAPGHCPPVFAGQEARFGLVLRNPGRRPRRSLALGAEGGPTRLVDVPAADSVEIALAVPAPRRGRLPLPRITLATVWPLGLVRAWAYAVPDQHCLVYPAPAADAPPLPTGSGHGGGLRQSGGNDDFAGLRDHRPGEPLHRVAWKAAARNPDGPLPAKHFAGEGVARLWLDWRDLPPGLATEQRIAVLARWVLDARAAGHAWGLRLPGQELSPAEGEAHLHRCLEALALFEPTDAANRSGASAP